MLSDGLAHRGEPLIGQECLLACHSDLPRTTTKD
jgi:hypothetical protein